MTGTESSKVARPQPERSRPERSRPERSRPERSRPDRRIVVVTGMSGAGRSTALRAMEDIGFEAVDNLPLRLASGLIRQAPDPHRSLALGLDIRSRGFDVPGFMAAMAALREQADAPPELVFIDCDDEVLRRRYTETRRTHPLAPDRSPSDGIAGERLLLAPLRAAADIVFDSSSDTVRAFSRRVQAVFGAAGSSRLQVFLTSFSYRHGLPRDADLVFDVRFLANPYYDEALRPLSGLDGRVADFIRRDAGFGAFFDRLTDLMTLLLPRYAEEGKSCLSVAVGCTGGRHRSVFVTGQLAAWFAAGGRPTLVVHRDMAAAPPPEVLL